MNNSAAHSALVNRIMIRLGVLPWVLIQKNATGVIENAKGGWIKYGMVGSGDIIGTLTLPCGIGQHFEIEAKTGTGRQTPEQESRMKTLRARGALYILARSEDDAEFGLREARERKWM